MLSKTEAGSPITQDDVAQNCLAVGPPVKDYGTAAGSLAGLENVPVGTLGKKQVQTPFNTRDNHGTLSPLEPSSIGIRFSPSFTKLVTSMLKARKSFDPVTKDVYNDFTKKKYADLAGVLDATVSHLLDNEILAIQAPSFLDGKITITTILSHTSGEWLINEFTTPLDGKIDPQLIGKAITYYRRYAIQALLNIAAEDDDGNAASGKEVQREPAKPRQSVDHKPAQPAERPRPNDKPVHSTEQTKTQNQPQPLAEELDPLPTPLELDNFKKKIRDLSGGGRPDKEKFLKLAGADPGTDPNKLTKQQWEKGIAAMEAK